MVNLDAKSFLLVLLIVTCSFCSRGAVDSTGVSDMKRAVDSLNAKLVSTQTALSELKVAFDKHVVSEGYFTSTLSGQTTIFSVIVAAICGLFSFLTFRGFKGEVAGVKKQIKEAETQFDKKIAEFDSKTSTLYRRLHSLGSLTIHSVINTCRFVSKFSYENMSKSGKLLRLRV